MMLMWYFMMLYSSSGEVLPLENLQQCTCGLGMYLSKTHKYHTYSMIEHPLGIHS